MGGGGQRQGDVAAGEVAEPGELPSADGRRVGAGLVLDPDRSGVGEPAPAVVGALVAVGAEGGRVAAGLGGEVAAEPEHVQPPPQPSQPVDGAEIPGGTDDAGGVRGDADPGQRPDSRRSPSPKFSAGLVACLARYAATRSVAAPPPMT